jgi:N-acetylglutamate synthase-like GNAT family acetyltransferase
MEFALREARPSDVVAIAELIAASVRGLALGVYDDRQIELSIKSVFGVDHQLIDDRTFFVAESDGRIIGCGGWSKRKTLIGASVYNESRDPHLIDPAIDAAKIRAFFVHPRAARKGIGRAILKRCETEAWAAGFRRAEMMATLPGVPLYAACGYEKADDVAVPVGEGLEIQCIRMHKQLI